MPRRSRRARAAIQRHKRRKELREKCAALKAGGAGLELQSQREEESEPAMCSANIQEASGSEKGNGEAGESAVRPPPRYEDQWFAPITEDLPSFDENSKGGPEGSTADTQGGGFLPLRRNRMRRSEMRRLKLRQPPRPVYECPLCGRSFRISSKLTAHLRADHKGEKPYSCEECGKAFSLSRSLMIHSRLHSGEWPYICEVCGKLFRHSVSLRSHRLSHSAIKPFSCEDCGKVFTQKCSLKLHRRIHTGEQPYECKECGRRFRYLCSLRWHGSCHSATMSARCKECGKWLKNLLTLRGHERIHTGALPHPCPVCGQRFRWAVQLRQHRRHHLNDPEELRQDGNPIGASMLTSPAPQVFQQDLKGQQFVPYRCHNEIKAAVSRARSFYTELHKEVKMSDGLRPVS